MQFRRKRYSPGLLVACYLIETLREDGFVPFGYKDQFRAAGSKIKFEHPRRGKILDKIQPARLFFAVGEVSIPVRLGPVLSVAARGYPKHSRIGTPCDAVAGNFSGEIEHPILVMSAVKIAT